MFHDLGLDTTNDRGNLTWATDQRWQRVVSVTSGQHITVRYDGAIWYRHLYAKKRLNTIRWAPGNLSSGHILTDCRSDYQVSTDADDRLEWTAMRLKKTTLLLETNVLSLVRDWWILHAATSLIRCTKVNTWLTEAIDNMCRDWKNLCANKILFNVVYSQNGEICHFLCSVISQGKVVALDRWSGKWKHLSMTHRLTTNCAKNYCNRTIIVKDIVENVVTCFFGTRCIHRYKVHLMGYNSVTDWLIDWAGFNVSTNIV